MNTTTPNNRARWILGTELSPEDRCYVFAAYVHRNTKEHPFPSSGGEPSWSDAEWLARTRFAVTKSGRLDSRVRRCETNYP